MRTVHLIVIHCSATKENETFTEIELEKSHRQRGLNGIGYHYYIRRDGNIKSTRPVRKPGAHARGHNLDSIAICYEGGLNQRGVPKDTRTEWQKHSMIVLIRALLTDFPMCHICGHRDLPQIPDDNSLIEPESWLRECPCFDAAREYGKRMLRITMVVSLVGCVIILALRPLILDFYRDKLTETAKIGRAHV